jgi:hypothetical protein
LSGKFILADLRHHATLAIDWNSDIVPSQDELQAQDKDALAKYFGKQMDNTNLFRTYETMERLVGEFKDVPLDKYCFAFDRIEFYGTNKHSSHNSLNVPS